MKTPETAMKDVQLYSDSLPTERATQQAISGRTEM